MMNLKKAREAFLEARSRYISQAKERGLSDISLGLEAMAHDLESRLDRIEANQRKILQLLSQQR